MTNWKSTLKQVGIRQNSKSELVALRVDVSDVSAVATSEDGIDEGASACTILKNGTGDYTITLKRACRRIPVVLGAVAVGEVFVRLESEPSTSAIRVIIEDDAGTNTDADFHLAFLAFYAETGR